MLMRIIYLYCKYHSLTGQVPPLLHPYYPSHHIHNCWFSLGYGTVSCDRWGGAVRRVDGDCVLRNSSCPPTALRRAVSRMQ